MTTSSSYDFTVTTQEVIEEALEWIGFLASGETPEDDDLTVCRTTLNLLVKLWSGPNNRFMPGLKMWQRERASLTLVASQGSYDLKPSGGDLDIQIPTQILTASLRDSSSNDTPMRSMTLEEYESIGDKSADGDPGAYYYERRTDTGKLYLDHKPSDTTKTIRLVYLQPIEDLDANANDLDFPVEYHLPIAHQIGVHVAPKFGIPLTQDHYAQAQASAQMVQTFEPPRSTVFFEPDKD